MSCRKDGLGEGDQGSGEDTVDSAEENKMELIRVIFLGRTAGSEEDELVWDFLIISGPRFKDWISDSNSTIWPDISDKDEMKSFSGTTAGEP